MNIEVIELKKLIPTTGYTLTNGEVFSKEVYLGCNDSADNWREITDKEAEEKQKELEGVNDSVLFE